MLLIPSAKPYQDKGLRIINTCVVLHQGLQDIHKDTERFSNFYINATNYELDKHNFQFRLELKNNYNKIDRELLSKHEICLYLYSHNRRCAWPFPRQNASTRIWSDCEWSIVDEADSMISGYAEQGGFCKHNETIIYSENGAKYTHHLGNLIIVGMHEFENDCQINTTMTTNTIIHLIMESFGYSHPIHFVKNVRKFQGSLRQCKGSLHESITNIKWTFDGVELNDFSEVYIPEKCVADEPEPEPWHKWLYYALIIIFIPTTYCYCKARNEYLREHSIYADEHNRIC